MFKNNRLNIILLNILLIFAQIKCSKETPADPPEMEGKFVVDEIKVSAIIKKTPSSDTMWCYIPFSIKSHFDECYGNCSRFSIMPDSLIGMSVFIDGPLVPQVNSFTFSDTLIEKKDFGKIDSLNITFKMKGAYFKKISDSKYEFLKEFSTTIIKKVAVME